MTWYLLYFFFNYTDKDLDITDLATVLNVFKESQFHNSNWRFLGLELGILDSTLDSIDANNLKDVDKCLLQSEA